MVALEFDAFISYARASDQDLAPILRRDLRRKLRRWWGASRLSIFLDRTSLEPGDSLPAKLRQRIEASRNFVLLASPQSAESPYVALEVAHWLQLHGIQNLLIALTDGEIDWRDGVFTTQTSLPAALRDRYEEVPLYLDLRPFRSGETRKLEKSVYSEALAGLVARLTGHTKEWVLGEERSRRRRVTAIGLTVFALLTTLGTLALRAAAGERIERKRAKSNHLLQAAADCLAEDPELSVRLALEASSLMVTPKVLEMAAAGMESWRPGNRVHVHLRGIKSITFSSDGSKLITTSSDGTAAVLSWPGLEVESRLRGHGEVLATAGLDSTGERAFTLAFDRTVCLWRVRDQKLVQRLPRAFGMSATEITFDSAARMLRVSSANGQFRCFDQSTGLEVETPTQRSRAAPSAKRALSSDGSYELHWSPNGECRLIDVRTAPDSSLPVAPEGVLAAAFRPGGHEFATCSGDERIHFWQAADFHRSIEVVSADQPVVGLVFSPDGRWLAALPPTLGRSDAPNQFSILIYDCVRRAAHWNLRPRVHRLTTVCFSPGSDSIVAATMEGELEVWPVNPLERAAQCGPRSLLAAERVEFGVPAGDQP